MSDDGEGTGQKTEKSEWEKKMEEISRKEREKWKKYRTERSVESSNPEDQTNFELNFGNGLSEKQSKSIADLGSQVQSEVQETGNLGSGSRAMGAAGGRMDDLNTFDEVLGNKNTSDDKKVEVENAGETSPEFSKNEEGDPGKLAERKSPFKSSEDYRVSRIDAEGKSVHLGEKNQPSEIIGGEKLEGESKSSRSRGMVTSAKSSSRRNIRTGNRKEKFLNEVEEFSEYKELSPENIIKGRWGMSESEPPKKFLDDISRKKKIIEGIEEGGRIKSPGQESQRRKNLIVKSKNEYWISRDDPREIEDLGKNNRWVSGAINKYEDSVENQAELSDSGNDDEKFIESDWRQSRVASKLVKIIIAPYAVATPERLELSIDRLIPESNEDFRMTELQMRPIVIGLSTTLCDKAQLE